LQGFGQVLGSCLPDLVAAQIQLSERGVGLQGCGQLLRFCIPDSVAVQIQGGESRVVAAETVAGGEKGGKVSCHLFFSPTNLFLQENSRVFGEDKLARQNPTMERPRSIIVLAIFEKKSGHTIQPSLIASFSA
jgi:hypothetical protein